MPHAIRIRREVAHEIAAHARLAPHLECCGLLAGADGVIARAYPATNVAPNPAVSYDVAVKELLDRMREIREAGLEFLGIYHSHPATINEPSPRDVELAAYPDAAYFIFSAHPDAPRPLRAFAIRGGQVQELEIEIV